MAGQPRPSRWLLIPALLTPTAFAVAMLWIAIDPPEGAGFLSRHRVPVDPETGRLVFAGGGLVLAALVLRVVVGTWKRGSGQARPKRRGSRALQDLQPGEFIRWRGRMGRAVLTRARWTRFFTLVVPLSLPLLGLSIGAYAHFHQQGMDRLPASFLFLNWAIAVFLLGWAAMLALVAPFYWLFRDNRWLCEFAGEVVVTDRRMLWITPWRRMAHERDRDTLLGVEVIEPGWIELAEIVELDDQRVEARRDLRGVEDEAAALAAIRWLIR